MPSSDLEETSAKEAFIDDDFAIALNPSKADLYVTDAVADANKAIESDPSMGKAYLRKGIACMKLEECETAKTSLETGSSLTPGDSRFTNLIKECDQRIAEEVEEPPSQLASKSAIEVPTPSNLPSATVPLSQEVTVPPTKPKYSPPKKPLKNKQGEKQQREACCCGENQHKASFYEGNRQKAPKPNSKSRVANDKVLDPKQYFENEVKFLGGEKVAGINPCPPNFFATMSITEYKEKFGGLDNGDRLEDVQVSLAGRIMSKRPSSSKLIFYDLHGGGSKVQVMADARNSELEQAGFSKFHSSVKECDIVGVTGFPAKSKRGELSIASKSFVVLSHCLLPGKNVSSLENTNNVQIDATQCIKEVLLFPPALKKSTTGEEDCFEECSSPAQNNNNNNNHLSSSSSIVRSCFRIAIVGDIHEDWKLEHDSKALHFLNPDLVMFTGDFGNENVELVKGIATELNFPIAAILGNHDSWSTSKFTKKVKDGVQLQLECLGEAHVGYDHLDIPPLKLSVVGGRPFSCGGNQLFRKKLLTPRYGVHDMEESAERIYKAALGTPEEHSIIFLAHNGPTGLGSNVDDICGMDWASEGGDHGDPDLAKAISQLKETTKYRIPLVVFGHMHKELACGGLRKMVTVDADNTMYLNAAIVPRVKYPSSGGSTRAFTVVEFSGGKITKVAETWVSIIDDKAASLEEELLLFSSN